MKINEITLTEAPAGGVFPTAKADIIAWQKANGLKPDGLIGDKTYAAMSAAGMKALPGFQKVPNKPKAPAAKPAEPAADSTAAPNNDSSSMTGAQTPVTPPEAAGDQTAGGKTNADFLPGAAGGAQDIARLQQTAGVRPGGVAFNQDAVPGASQGQTTTVRPGGVAFNQDAPPAEPAQAAQAAQAAEPAAGEFTPVPSGYDTTPKPVMSAGGKTNVTTGSDDEMAWRSKNPNWNMTGKQYPGAGNWDPKSGRDLKAAAQGEKNWNAIKNLFGAGKKDQPAQAAQAAQAAPPATGGTQGPQTPGGYGRFNEDDDLTAMLRIAGLK